MRCRGFDPHQFYVVEDGRMWNGLTVVAFQLTDINPGDGGLCLVPGKLRVLLWQIQKQIFSKGCCRT